MGMKSERGAKKSSAGEVAMRNERKGLEGNNIWVRIAQNRLLPVKFSETSFAKELVPETNFLNKIFWIFAFVLCFFMTPT